jgi:PAS domain S-box-containing protein
MGEAIAWFPWHDTELGTLQGWPQSMRSAVNLMLEAGAAAAFFHGPNHRMLYNDRYRDLIHDKHPAALGRSAVEVFSEVWPTVAPLFAQAQGGEAVTIEDISLNLVRRGVEETAFFSGSYNPVRDENGVVIGFLALVVETTRRVMQERERAEVFDTTLSAITDFAYTFDRDGRFLYVNKALLDLWGLPLAAAVGRNFHDLKYPLELADRLQQQIQQVIHTRQILRDETPYTSPTGASGYYEYIFSPVFSPDGSVSVVAGSTRDISLRKNLELKVQETVIELRAAKQLLERQSQVLEQQVIERTAKLQETITELESFSYSISHDLRGPLRTMQSFAQALREDCGEELSATGKDYIRRIVSAADRMDRIIQDVLVYSRIARTDLTLEPIALEDFIRSLLDSYPSFHAAHEAISIKGELPVVLGNPAALTQCIANLLGNALKFVAPSVDPEVTISCEVVNGRAHVSVRDNGIGIPRESHEAIFGVFCRLAQNYDGTGIGLAIVRKAVERMGGNISVESSPGRGSNFTFDLALGKAS